MVQILVQYSSFDAHADIACVEYSGNGLISLFHEEICTEKSIPKEGSLLYFANGTCLNYSGNDIIEDYFTYDGILVELRLPLIGGIDFQHREGGKTGSGGPLSESQAALERKERLRKLALETIDITKDPYFMRNHLGTFECKLCLTLHPNEGNYLAHTQGKRHQYNLGRRAAMEAKNAAPRTMVIKEAPVKRIIKIGRPGYKVSAPLLPSLLLFLSA